MLDPLSLEIPLAGLSSPQPTYPQRKLLQPSPDHPDDYIMELDYSSASMFIECPTKWMNFAIHGREANRDTSALDFGGLFHTLDEFRLRNKLTPEVKAKQAETIAMHFLQHPVPPTDYRTADMMTSVMAKYNKIYEQDAWPEKVLVVDGEPMIERPFKVELVTVAVETTLPFSEGQLVANHANVYKLAVRNLHILYTGRIDAVLTEGDMIWVVDRKTTSRGGKEFEETFRLSLQTRGYCWAAQKLLGQPVAGLILDGAIVRAPTRTGKGTEFLRRNYFYSQDSLAEWEDCMKGHAANIVSHLVRGFFPQSARSFASPCEVGGGCPYKENCTLPRNQRAADLASELYRDVTWNPMH